MLFFTIRRILSSVLVLLASSFLVFALCAASFDPLAKFRQKQPPPTQQSLDALAHQLGLDKPFLVRYWDWLDRGAARRLRQDITGHRSATRSGRGAGVTSRMIIAAVIIAVVLAIVVGVIGAVRQYKPSDYVLHLCLLHAHRPPDVLVRRAPQGVPRR